LLSSTFLVIGPHRTRGKTSSAFDIRERAERYVVLGALFRWIAFGRRITGQGFPLKSHTRYSLDGCVSLLGLALEVRTSMGTHVYLFWEISSQVIDEGLREKRELPKLGVQDRLLAGPSILLALTLSSAGSGPRRIEKRRAALRQVRTARTRIGLHLVPSPTMEDLGRRAGGRATEH